MENPLTNLIKKIMKKYYFLSILALILCACNSENDEPGLIINYQPDYDGASIEKVWVPGSYWDGVSFVDAYTKLDTRDIDNLLKSTTWYYESGQHILWVDEKHYINVFGIDLSDKNAYMFSANLEIYDFKNCEITKSDPAKKGVEGYDIIDQNLTVYNSTQTGSAIKKNYVVVGYDGSHLILDYIFSAEDYKRSNPRSILVPDDITPKSYRVVWSKANGTF